MKLRDLSREMKIMLLAMVIANTAGAMIWPLMPLYLEYLGASVQNIGFFFTAQVILGVCFRILGGWISDHMGRLVTIAMGGMVGLVGHIALAAAPSWEWTLISALMGAIGSSLVGPSFQAYTAEQAPEGSTSSTFGLVTAIYGICMIIGPVVGGLLADYLGYRALLWISAGIFVIAALLRIGTAYGKSWRVDELRPTELVSEIRGLVGLIFAGSGLLLWLFLVDGLSDASSQLALPFLPKFVTERGAISESGYGILVALMSLVGALAMVPGGMFADRFGERYSIAVGFVFAGGTWLLMVLYPGLIVFGIVFTLAGVAQAFIGPAFSSLVSKAVPKESLGITWGIFWTALGVLAIPAPYIGGLLYDYVAPEATFVVAAICSALAIPLALRKLRLPAKEKRGDQSDQDDFDDDTRRVPVDVSAAQEI
ncbi:MAG: MFS transporter [Anaerolineae bacterium]|nr:MFS transporter [Anaerolineae bacterium]